MGCLTAKASGSIASFITPTVTPIESARVYFSPTQLGDGIPSPDNVREIVGRTGVELKQCGKNLIKVSEETRAYAYVGGSATKYTENNNIIIISGASNGGYLVSCKPNTQYTYSCEPTLRSGGVYLRVWELEEPYNGKEIPSGHLSINQNVNSTAGSVVTFTTKANTYYLVVGFYIYSTAAETGLTISDFQLELGDTRTSYEPYQGTTIPFSWKRLPDEYQEVEYIESDGNSYLSIPYLLQRYDEISTKIYSLTNVNTQVPFSYGIGKYQTIIVLNYSDAIYIKYFDTGNAPKIEIENNKIPLLLSIDSTGLLICKNENDEILGMVQSSYKQDIDGDDKNLYLFIRANKESAFYGRNYGFKITNNNTIKLNLVPCYRKSDNEIGMYDTVSQTFYTNQGTGSFTKGDDVFSDEVYGGYVDLVKGEIVETYGKFVFNGDENIDWHGWGDDFYIHEYITDENTTIPFMTTDFTYCNMQQPMKSRLANMPSGNMSIVGGNDLPSHTYLVCSSDGYGDSLEECKAKLKELYDDGTPLTVVTPYKDVFKKTHPLPDYLKTQLQTLKNENNIWSDADSVEIEYGLAETFDIQKAKRKIIMNQPHVETLTGDAVSFTTDMKAPLKECKVSFMPIQEGEGDPSPTNVRNIVGWNGVSVKNGENTYSIDWTDDVGTVYGGYVDLMSGVLTATVKCIDMGTENWHYATQTSVQHFYCLLDDKLYSQNEYIPCWCSCYNFWGNGISSVIYSEFADKEFGAQVTNGMIRLRDDSITDVTTFKESVSGQTLAYPLREPITYQLTPQQILSLKGINNFSCGIKNDMTVKYWKHKLSDSANIAYEAENLAFNGTNYIDTGVYLFSEKNINRDFEVVIEDLYGGNSSNNTIVCAKYNGTAIGFLIRLNSAEYTRYNGTISMKINNHNNITIKRINGVITIDGEVITNPTVQFTNTVHNHPLVLGCALEDDGTPYRYATGTIGHITVKWL